MRASGARNVVTCNTTPGPQICSYGATTTELRTWHRCKLMTTDAVYDKEILIASHLERRRRLCSNQDQAHVA